MVSFSAFVFILGSSGTRSRCAVMLRPTSRRSHDLTVQNTDFLFVFSVAAIFITNMDLHELFQQRLQKIELLNDFVVLYGRKEETLTDLQAISSEVDEIGSLLKSCADILNKFQHENRQKCQQLIEKSQQQQLRMLDVLEKVIDLDAKKDSQAASNVLPMPNSEVKSVRQLVLSEIGNTPTPIKFVPFKSGEQPVMTLADYMKSPYATKRMRPLALQFTDFEKTITADEFAKIPK